MVGDGVPHSSIPFLEGVSGLWFDRILESRASRTIRFFTNCQTGNSHIIGRQRETMHARARCITFRDRVGSIIAREAQRVA